MEIYLVRHTATAVPEGTCYGQTDVPLRDTFEAEAEQVRTRLDGLSFDAVFSSPLSRCTRLATACGHAHPQLDNRLLEMNMGEWEMQRFDEIADERLQLWYDDYLRTQPTGGESFEQLYLRVADFMNQLVKQPYQSVVIFAHGGVLLAARMWEKQSADPRELLRNLTPFGCIEHITV